MSLTLPAIGLVLLLLPGIVFRLLLYTRSPVSRVLSTSNSIYVVSLVVTVSAVVHLASGALFAMLSYLFGGRDITLLRTQSGISFAVEGVEMDFVGFLLEQWGHAALYGLLVLLVTVSALTITVLTAQRFASFGRLIYGPLARVLVRRDGAGLTCYVLTKITYGSKRVIYSGGIDEVGLISGSRIDHIVLRDPEKYAVDLGAEGLESTQGHARPLSQDGWSSNALYISGEEIENVHFETWRF